MSKLFWCVFSHSKEASPRCKNQSFATAKNDTPEKISQFVVTNDRTLHNLRVKKMFVYVIGEYAQ